MRNRFSMLLLVALFGYVLYQRLPSFIASVKLRGEVVKPFTVITENGQAMLLPLSGRKQVLVFWATWCGPCTVELSRLNSAVKGGELKADQIIAVSLGEEPNAVWAEAKKRDYRFVVAADPELKSQTSLDVYGTPQTYHIDQERTVAYAGMGLSLFPVQHARYFLADEP
jgi:cytochrome c biogenesis protein CcmG/thiol:disulfide interchange protein DsbE